MSKNDDLVRRELTIAELQTAHIERQEEWCPEQKPDLSFRGNEMAGEVGEACNVIKKLERERQGWRGSRATKAELSEELADVVHTAVLCAITAGIELQAAIVDKFNATSEKNGLSTMLSDALERGAEQGVMTDETAKRADDALVSAASLIKALCSDDISSVAIEEIEFARSALTSAPPAPQAADIRPGAANGSLRGERQATAIPPAPAPDAGEDERIVSSAIKEYELVDNLAGEHENMGRKAAVRGMMVRLGLYTAFNEALNAGDDAPTTPQPPAVEAEAERYDVTDACGMAPAPNGKWVRFTTHRAVVSALKAKTDENERLRRERDEARAQALENGMALCRERNHRQAAEASNKALREGLEPFAAIAEELENEPAWAGVLEHDHPLSGRVTVADFRRARALLSKTGGE